MCVVLSHQVSGNLLQQAQNILGKYEGSGLSFQVADLESSSQITCPFSLGYTHVNQDM